MDETLAVVVGVDTGGTFTDLFSSNGQIEKVASSPRDPVAAIRSGLEKIDRSAGRSSLAHGTTVATNAILERKGARTVLLTTAGFEDVLEIRRQNRPSLYDLSARWPDPLVPREGRLGIDERLDHRGHVLRALDLKQAREAVDRIPDDVEAVSICLLFSYANWDHERLLAELVRQRLGARFPISLSSEVAPQQGEYERTATTVINAYVLPEMGAYLASLGRATSSMSFDRLHVMQSNGGLADVQTVTERPVKTILSGPAAGVVGARLIAELAGREQIITFDMGGTSTDVAVVPGEILESGIGEIDSFPLFTPMLTIETVGAGGGSIARLNPVGGLHVGPESAGADPGPAAYGTATRPTVTDANLILGRLSTTGLLDGQIPLDLQRSRRAMEVIGHPLGLSIEQAAWSVLALALSNTDRAVRRATLQRGFDPRRFTLFAFGGAGPLHAAELATMLGIKEILVPPHPGVMAALGLTVPDLVKDVQQTVLIPVRGTSGEELEVIFQDLEGSFSFESEDDQFGPPEFTRYVECRFAGQSYELRIPYSSDPAELTSHFVEAYRHRYGYAPSQKPVEVVHARLRATQPRRRIPRLTPNWPVTGRAPSQRAVAFASEAGLSSLSWLSTRILWRPSLASGTNIEGPALVEQYDSTTLIPPGWAGHVDDHFNLLLRS